MELEEEQRVKKKEHALDFLYSKELNEGENTTNDMEEQLIELLSILTVTHLLWLI